MRDARSFVNRKEEEMWKSDLCQLSKDWNKKGEPHTQTQQPPQLTQTILGGHYGSASARNWVTPFCHATGCHNWFRFTDGSFETIERRQIYWKDNQNHKLIETQIKATFVLLNYPRLRRHCPISIQVVHRTNFSPINANELKTSPSYWSHKIVNYIVNLICCKWRWPLYA